MKIICKTYLSENFMRLKLRFCVDRNWTYKQSDKYHLAAINTCWFDLVSFCQTDQYLYNSLCKYQKKNFFIKEHYTPDLSRAIKLESNRRWKLKSCPNNFNNWISSGGRKKHNTPVTINFMNINLPKIEVKSSHLSHHHHVIQLPP